MNTNIRKENEAYQIECTKQSISEFKWVEVTEERYDYMLCVLPPEIMLKGGFLVGEPTSHRRCKMTNCFKPTFDGFKRVGSYDDADCKFFATSEPVTISEFKALMGKA